MHGGWNAGRHREAFFGFAALVAENGRVGIVGGVACDGEGDGRRVGEEANEFLLFDVRVGIGIWVSDGEHAGG